MSLVVMSTIAALATPRDRVAPGSVTNGRSRFQGRSVAGTLSYRGSRVMRAKAHPRPTHDPHDRAPT